MPKVTRRGGFIVLLVLLPGLLAGCQTRLEEGGQVWIDTPRDGERLTAGEPVEVRSHAYSERGVQEVLLRVDGEPYRRDPPRDPGSEFTQVSQSWQPEEPGDVLLQVIAYDGRGEPGGEDAVLVHVVPQVAQAPTDSPAPGATPTPALEPTAAPPLSLRFWAEEESLIRGDCTTLRWEVSGANTVQLDGQEVAAVGSKQVCPDAAVSYRLHALSSREEAEERVTLAVSEPPDTSPPAISEVTASENQIYQPFCEPNTVTFRAQVRDDRDVARVELVYRVVDGSRQGGWRTLRMEKAGAERYKVKLDWADLEASLDPPVTGTATIEYSVRARDGAGNTSQSGQRTVTLKECLL